MVSSDCTSDFVTVGDPANESKEDIILKRDAYIRAALVHIRNLE